MTMTVPVTCPSCQATYQAPKEREGARFKCKKCGTTLTVPRSEPPAPPVAPARPVVMPAQPPVEAPAAKPRPVVMPAEKPAPALKGPVFLPPPAEGERRVVMPASTPKPAEPRPSTRPRPERAARPPRDEEEAEAPKSRMNLVLAVIGGLVLLGGGGYLMFGRGGSEPPKPPENPKIESTSPKVEKISFDAATKVADFKKETGTASAGQLWALVKKLDAEGKTWEEKKAPPEAIEALGHEEDLALEELLRIEPDHAAARDLRGEVKYKNELDPFFDAAYLSDSERELVRRNRLTITTRAGENAGWISKKAYDKDVKPLVDKFTERQGAAESLATSPFGIEAKKLEVDTMAYLSEKLGGKTAFRAFVHKPYVIFVEENPGWSPATVAQDLFSPLKAILEAFLKEFGGLGLKPLETPVPVIYFMSEARYREYNEKIGNVGMAVLAHYEPAAGRLCLNRGVNHEVIIHEGTHQVFDKYTTNTLPHPKQSFWFQEGIAEWFGGSNRLQAKDGSWAYETGVLLSERLSGWRKFEDAEFKLADLLQQTYGKRNEYIMMGPDGQKKIGLVYAQGWFLIYFLNHFNVDPTGMVKIGAKGKYADGWSEYLKAELSGKTGKKVFMECLKLDDAGLEKMDKEYKDYFRYVMKKYNIGQVKEKKLVPWDQWVNAKGVKAGAKPDDLLVEPPRNGK